MINPAIVDKQLQDIDLSGGVNERDRPETMDWTKYLTTAENVVVDQQKSLVKRPGIQTYVGAADGGGSFNPIYRLLPFNDGLGFVGANFNLYHANEAALNVGPGNKGPMPEFGIRSIDTVCSVASSGAATSGGTLCATAATSRYKIVAYKAAGNNPTTITIVIRDRFSSNTVRKYRAVTAGGAGTPTFCMAVVGDEYLHCCLSNGINRPFFFQLDLLALPPPASGAITPGPNITGTVGGENVVAVIGGSTFSTVICSSAANTFFEKFNTSGASTATATVAVAFLVTSADSDATTTSNPTKYVITYTNATPKFVARFLDSTFTTTRTVTDATATTTSGTQRVGMDTSGNIRIVVYRQATTAAVNHPRVDVFLCATADVTYTYVATMDDWCEMSQPFFLARTSKFYVALAKLLAANSGASASFETIGQISIVDITAAITPAAAAATQRQLRSAANICNYTATLDHVSTATGVYANSQPPPRPALTDSNYRIHAAYTYNATTQSYAYEMVELSILHPAAISNDNDIFGGGKVGTYDGSVPQDLGFIDSPSCFVTSAAGAIPAGTYNYVVVHECKDVLGRSHFSRTSRVASVTTVVASQMTVQSSMPAVCDHDNFVFDATGAPVGFVSKIYRTTSGGTTYYYVGKVAAGASYLDTSTDATISANPALFRQPGTQNAALDRYAPVMARDVVRHKDRVFYARGSTIYFSSFDVSGEAPWFNPAFSFSVPGGKGDITALASMEGLLVIFKKDSVHVVDGDGPPENGGTGTEFSPPRRILTENGCLDQRTLITTPLGIMYRSGLGFMLLDRSFRVQWIGDRVLATTRAYPIVGGACFDLSSNRALFIVGAAEDSRGIIADTTQARILCYDVTSDAWTTWQAKTFNTQGGGLIDLAFTYFTYTGVEAGTVFVATENTIDMVSNSGDCCDSGPSGNFVPIKLETGWIKKTPQERIRLSDFLFLASKITNHNLKISVAYDYSPTYSYSKTWTPADINGLAIEQLELQIPQQAHMAFRIKIEDTAPADTGTYPIGNGNGPGILALTARLGVVGGGAKLADGQKG